MSLSTQTTSEDTNDETVLSPPSTSTDTSVYDIRTNKEKPPPHLKKKDTVLKTASPLGEYPCLKCTKARKAHEELLLRLAKREKKRKTCHPWNAARFRILQEERKKACYEQLKSRAKQPCLAEIPFLQRNFCLPKIILSLRPDEYSVRELMNFIENRVYIFHIDIRYGTSQQHLKTIKNVREAVQIVNEKDNMEHEIAIAMEISGRLPEVGGLKTKKPIELKKMEPIKLTCDRHRSNNGDEACIYVNFQDFIPKLKKRDIVMIGKDVKLEVVNISRTSIVCLITHGGKIEQGMEVVLPGNITGKRVEVTQEQHKDIQFAFTNDASYIVCQAGYQKELYDLIRWEMTTSKKNRLLFGKVDPKSNITDHAMQRLLEEFSGLWLCYSHKARVSFQEVDLIKQCLDAAKPIVRSGTFLATGHVKLPDDLETIRSFSLYPDALLFKQDELGKIDIENLKQALVDNFPETNEVSFDHSCSKLVKPLPEFSPSLVLLKNAVFASIFNQASCFVTVSNSGRIAALLSSFRPVTPIFATVRCEVIAQNLLIYKNVFPLVFFEPVMMQWKDELEERIAYGEEVARRYGKIDKSTAFIVYFDSRPGLLLPDSYRVIRPMD